MKKRRKYLAFEKDLMFATPMAEFPDIVRIVSESEIWERKRSMRRGGRKKGGRVPR